MGYGCEIGYGYSRTQPNKWSVTPITGQLWFPITHKIGHTLRPLRLVAGHSDTPLGRKYTCGPSCRCGHNWHKLFNRKTLVQLQSGEASYMLWNAGYKQPVRVF